MSLRWSTPGAIARCLVTYWRILTRVQTRRGSGALAPPQADKYFSEIEALPHYDARYYRGALSSEERREGLKLLLFRFSEFCAARGLPFFLVHGSLLGWYWGKSMLPWDDDIDVSVSMDVLRALHSMRGFIDGSRYQLDVNPNYTDRSTRNRSFRQHREPNKIDARFIDTSTGLFLDITGVSEVGSARLASKCPHVYRTEDIFPLRQETFEGVPVFVPRNGKKVVHQEYGRLSTSREVFNEHRWWPASNRWLPVGQPPCEYISIEGLKAAAACWDLHVLACFRRTVACWPSKKRLVPVRDKDDAPLPVSTTAGDLSDEVIFFKLKDRKTGALFWGKQHNHDRMKQLPLEIALYQTLSTLPYHVVFPLGFSDQWGLLFRYDEELFHGVAVHVYHSRSFFRFRELFEIWQFGNHVISHPVLGRARIRTLADFQTVRTVQGLKFIDFTVNPEFWNDRLS